MTSMIDHELFQRSELLIQNLLQTINHPPYDRSSRVCASGNLCQISIEHSCGVRTLSETRMFPSAFVVLWPSSNPFCEAFGCFTVQAMTRC